MKNRVINVKGVEVAILARQGKAAFLCVGIFIGSFKPLEFEGVRNHQGDKNAD